MIGLVCAAVLGDLLLFVGLATHDWPDVPDDQGGGGRS